MAVKSVDFCSAFSCYKQFEKDVIDLTEKQVVDYVQSHSLDFLQNEGAIKIRKKKEGGGDRSSCLLQSLVILPNGMLFRTGKDQKNSIPGCQDSNLLGKGCFKDVYKVEELSSKTFVAIAVNIHQDFIYTMKNEYDMTQLVKSPYVLQIQSFGRRRSRRICQKAYVISELCQGTLLGKGGRNYLQQKPELLRQVKAGLDACYMAGVEHNDVYTDNILIKMNGDVALCDFGMAKLFRKHVQPIRYCLSKLRWCCIGKPSKDVRDFFVNIYPIKKEDFMNGDDVISRNRWFYISIISFLFLASLFGFVSQFSLIAMIV